MQGLLTHPVWKKGSRKYAFWLIQYTKMDQENIQGLLTHPACTELFAHWGIYKRVSSAPWSPKWGLLYVQEALSVYIASYCIKMENTSWTYSNNIVRTKTATCGSSLETTTSSYRPATELDHSRWGIVLFVLVTFLYNLHSVTYSVSQSASQSTMVVTLFYIVLKLKAETIYRGFHK